MQTYKNVLQTERFWRDFACNYYYGLLLSMFISSKDLIGLMSISGAIWSLIIVFQIGWCIESFPFNNPLESFTSIR